MLGQPHVISYLPRLEGFKREKTHGQQQRQKRKRKKESLFTRQFLDLLVSCQQKKCLTLSTDKTSKSCQNYLKVRHN